MKNAMIKGYEGIYESKRKASRGLRSKPIIQFDLAGNLVNKFVSAQAASNKTGINLTSICSCARETRKPAGGFVFKYEMKRGEM